MLFFCLSPFLETCRKNLISSRDMRSIYSMHEKRPKAQPGLSFSWRDAQKLRRRGCFGKKIRGSSFNYKTLERDSITDSIGIFRGKRLLFLFICRWCRLGWHIKVFWNCSAIFMPWSWRALPPIWKSEFATSRWALKIFGTFGDT